MIEDHGPVDDQQADGGRGIARRRRMAVQQGGCLVGEHAHETAHERRQSLDPGAPQLPRHVAPKRRASTGAGDVHGEFA